MKIIFGIKSTTLKKYDFKEFGLYSHDDIIVLWKLNTFCSSDQQFNVVLNFKLTTTV